MAAVAVVALVPAGTGPRHERPRWAPLAATTTAELTSPADASVLPTPSAAPTDAPAPSPPPTEAPVPPVLPPAAPAHPPAPPPPAAPPPPPGPPPVTIAVPWYHQQYSLSCEESSLSMVLSFYGHPTTEQSIFGYVTIDSAHPAAGVPGGGDPYVAFVGDPNGSEVQQTGYGVYWPRIAAAAGAFGAGVDQAGEGVAPSAIYAAVRAGRPALVWVTFDLRPHPRADYQAWDGRTIPYAGPWEHVMVVTGIDAGGVRVNDPDRSQYWVTFAQFEAAYAVYNQMAVVFADPAAGATPTPQPPTPTPSPSPAPSASPTPSPSPTPTPSPSPTPTPSPSPTPTA